MKNLFLSTLVVLLSFMAFSAQKSKKVAIVKAVRGKAEMLSPVGEKAKLKKGMWIKEGTIIKTSNKSFVRLSFIDKSSMNIGPKSELKIEKFSKKEAGVINVLTGKIRSQVTKDYLDMEKGKSKLFVKSRNAVMGVRGTDFLFSANKKTGATTTILFEGSIVFNKIKKGDNIRDLEGIVNSGRKIRPGEVSVAMRSRTKPTVPAKMSTRQFEKLNTNSTFKISEVKNVKQGKSIVPPGLSGAVVAGDTQNLKDEIKKIVKVKMKDRKKPEDGKVPNSEDSKGFIRGDDVRPADGIMVHVDTGTIIPPGIDSTFDKNAGEWVSATNGGSNASGEYAPPQGYQMNDEGQLLKIDQETGKVKEVVVLDIRPVDQMPPISAAPTTEYTGPAINDGGIQGPSPASMDEVKDYFDKPVEDVMNEEDKMDQIIKQEIINRNPDGEIMLTNEDGYLPPPPMPADCSTCDQPPSLFNNTTTNTTIAPKKTKVNVRVNKQ
jgi:hypothetical protein